MHGCPGCKRLSLRKRTDMKRKKKTSEKKAQDTPSREDPHTSKKKVKENTGEKTEHPMFDVLAWLEGIAKIGTNKNLAALYRMYQIYRPDEIFLQLRYGEDYDSFEHFFNEVLGQVENALERAKTFDELSFKECLWIQMVRLMKSKTFSVPFLEEEKGKKKTKKKNSANDIALRVFQVIYIYLLNKVAIHLLFSEKSGTEAEKELPLPFIKFARIAEECEKEIVAKLSYFPGVMEKIEQGNKILEKLII